MYLTHHQPDSFIRHWYWRQKMFRCLCYAKTNISLVSLLVSFLQQEQETSYTILRSKGTNVTLSGLKPDTTYLLQIRARTAAGYGGSSRKFEFETSPDCKHLHTSFHSVLYLQSHSLAVTTPDSIHSQLCSPMNNTDKGSQFPCFLIQYTVIQVIHTI